MHLSTFRSRRCGLKIIQFSSAPFLRRPKIYFITIKRLHISIGLVAARVSRLPAPRFYYPFAPPPFAPTTDSELSAARTVRALPSPRSWSELVATSTFSLSRLDPPLKIDCISVPDGHINVPPPRWKKISRKRTQTQRGETPLFSSSSTRWWSLTDGGGSRPA